VDTDINQKCAVDISSSNNSDIFFDSEANTVLEAVEID